MSNTKVNRDNFIALQGFMITDLKLKGNELIIYACIYGFSQAENQVFSGSLQYLADWTNSTKQGVIKCLKSLIEKGYIHKAEKHINGVKFCEYYATKFNTPMQQSLTGGMQQSLPNNIDINIISKNKEKKESKGSFNDIIVEYAKTLDYEIRAEVTDLLIEWLKVRKAKRAALTDRAIQINIDKLNALAAQSGMNIPAYLREVICRGWAAFYPINTYGNSKPAAKIGANGIAISDEKSDLDDLF
jgi:hypothetical protein